MYCVIYATAFSVLFCLSYEVVSEDASSIATKTPTFKSEGLTSTSQTDAKVLLSVATRNRFWPHALSTLSLLQVVRYSRKHANFRGLAIQVEWHVIDDASDRNSRKKNAMIRDLVNRGFVQNYTKLPRPSGIVRVLRSFVDVFLSRADLDYWMHCDDDVLLAPSTLLRAVSDYHSEIAGWRRRSSAKVSGKKSKTVPSGGGVLAVFVNYWLDEQISEEPPAFPPFGVVPFLGGASYVVDRETLRATGNPWAQALDMNKKVSPHDAHMLWLRQLLPARGLPIWVRLDEPYECQHLANVNTLNFGRQPDWEAMWAIDHRSKRIVEVEGYNSVELRAALWNGGDMLQDFVLWRNGLAMEPVELPYPNKQEWSLWNYPKLHANYIEVGTSDFDALVQRHVWRTEIVGFSVEPVRTYFESLPSHGGENKTLLHVAVSDHDGLEHVFFVRPELVDSFMGSSSFCDRSLLRDMGLQECLPGWVRGTSSIKRWPEGVRSVLGDKLGVAMAMASVPAMTYSTLLTVYGVGAVDIVKIDAEGFDHIILQHLIDFAVATGVWPWQVQFEKNGLSDWRALDQQVSRLQNDFHYSCRMVGMESAACWRTDLSPLSRQL